MARLPKGPWPRLTRISRPIAGGMLLLIGMGWIIGLLGCGTPQERYRTLSYFLDGVPNPDAPAGAHVQVPGQQVTTSVRIVSRHKPYLDNQCATCHRSPSGEIQEFDLAYGTCVKCHKTVTTGQALMHGPVAIGQCKWCHAPHQSTEPALLRDTPIKVCTQCHDDQLLGNTPPEHQDGKTSCLQCHFGHGGAARNFLKPKPAPGAAAATAPATAPATRGATAPLSDPGTSLAPPEKEHAP